MSLSGRYPFLICSVTVAVLMDIMISPSPSGTLPERMIVIIYQYIAVILLTDT